MGGLDTNSCLQMLPTNEQGLADASNELVACEPAPAVMQEMVQLMPDSIWSEIDQIIEATDFSAVAAMATTTTTAEETTTATAMEMTNQQSRRTLVRRRNFWDVWMGTQLNYSGNLQRTTGAELEKHKFLQPKLYVCGYCHADMLNVRVYLRHLKLHREGELRHRLSRCNACGRLFDDVIQNKWHQRTCIRRAIVWL